MLLMLLISLLLVRFGIDPGEPVLFVLVAPALPPPLVEVKSEYKYWR